MPEVAPRGPQGTTVVRHRVHFPAFDGLRAIAALSVVVTHAAFISGFNVRSDFWGSYTARLDIGVAVFFLISGFLLYRPFVAARFAQQPHPTLRSYLRRRFLRIYPAFWVAFTLIVFVLPRTVTTNPSPGGFVTHYLLINIYWKADVLGPLQQSWSLATEVSFYAFLPLYAWTLRRIGARRGLLAELVGVAVLYAISVGFRLYVYLAGLQPAGMYKTWLPARIDMFALGMLFAVLSAWWTTGDRRAPAWLSHPAVPWLSWVAAFVSFDWVSKQIGLEAPANRGPVLFTTHQEMELHFLYGLFAFFLIAPAIFGPQDRGAIRRFLNQRVVQWIGLVSYGIYIWHEEVLDSFLVWFHRKAFEGGSVLGWHLPFGIDPAFAEMLVFITVGSIAVAAVSYYVVERPVLRLKDRPLRLWPRRPEPPSDDLPPRLVGAPAGPAGEAPDSGRAE